MSQLQREAEGVDRVRKAVSRGLLLRLRVVASLVAWGFLMFATMELHPGELISFAPMAGFVLGVLPVAGFPVWAAIQALVLGALGWVSPTPLAAMGPLAWVFFALYLLLNVALYLQRRAERSGIAS